MVDYNAVSNTFITTSLGVFSTPDTSEYDRRLKSIASKLDISPIDENSPCAFRMVLAASDGAKYDMMEIMEKFLAKMDEKL